MNKLVVIRIRHPIPNNVLASIRIDRNIAYPSAGRARCPQRAARVGINHILNHAHPRHRITEHLRKRIRIDRMPFAVINERRVKLRNTPLQHFAIAGFFSAT